MSFNVEKERSQTDCIQTEESSDQARLNLETTQTKSIPAYEPKQETDQNVLNLVQKLCSNTVLDNNYLSVRIGNDKKTVNQDCVLPFIIYMSFAKNPAQLF
ncbi:hypothetical protein DFA_10399 [Cavenderia fasciculata]|uniref:Uncharacterized protein n=1 Tax=Cavenderia fasciculata TaxID=261658 RepID=F4QA38_CACFS|nr:uncharacterized protein DFA_10399 [Cavenderia fasciculata]EGG15557.1 hypothetical protein DFA_10399 [Cavenderia fasciculata]|eukprot:XP_004354299.1 hypothetical protein DFA_10399 [Cavenderia fasciculata]